MSSSLKTFGLEGLSPEERLLLAEELWDSLIDEPANIPLTDAQRVDLQQRLDAYRADPQAGSPWEEVKARLRGRA